MNSKIIDFQQKKLEKSRDALKVLFKKPAEGDLRSPSPSEKSKDILITQNKLGYVLGVPV